MSFIPFVDFHIHSAFSDGEGDLESIIRTAKDKALEMVAITDHFDPYQPTPDGNPAWKNIDINSFRNRFIKARDRIFASHNPRIIFGVETGPVSSKALYETCDIVIGSAHYIPGYSPDAASPGKVFDETYWQTYQDTVIKIIKDPYVDIIGHIEGYLPLAPLLNWQTTFEERRELEREITRRYFTDGFWEAVIRNALRYKKALEIHGMTQTPRPYYLAKAIRSGVLVSIGSDAHRISDIGRVDWGINILREIGLADGQLFLGRVKTDYPDENQGEELQNC
jgi:histidinol phosphatase-like PHP family hydrolase